MNRKRSSLLLFRVGFLSCTVYLASSASSVLGQTRNTPPDGSSDGGSPDHLTLTLLSIDPFLTMSTPASPVLRLPKHTNVTFSASYLKPSPGMRFRWNGAQEQSQSNQTSAAFVSFRTPGKYFVKVTPMFLNTAGQLWPNDSLTKSIEVDVTNVPAESIRVTIVPPPILPFVVRAQKKFTCQALTSIPGYEHLIQWSGGGSPKMGTGGSFETSYTSHGSYVLQAGKSDSANITVYEVTKIQRFGPRGQMVWYGFPITFAAQTTPSQYADRVTWKVETMGDMHTHAEPTVGQGALFTTTFSPTTSYRSSFWAQVFADQAAALPIPDVNPPAWPPCNTSGIDTMVQFVDFAACFLTFTADSKVARRSPEDQTRAAQYVTVYHDAVTHLHNYLINQMIPALSSSDLATFEQSLNASDVMNEFTTFFQIFDPNVTPPPSQTATAWADKQDEGAKQGANTVKNFLEDFIKFVGKVTGSETLQKFAKAIVEIIIEILGFLGINLK